MTLRVSLRTHTISLLPTLHYLHCFSGYHEHMTISLNHFNSASPARRTKDTSNPRKDAVQKKKEKNKSHDGGTQTHKQRKTTRDKTRRRQNQRHRHRDTQRQTETEK